MIKNKIDVDVHEKIGDFNLILNKDYIIPLEEKELYISMGGYNLIFKFMDVSDKFKDAKDIDRLDVSNIDGTSIFTLRYGKDKDNFGLLKYFKEFAEAEKVKKEKIEEGEEQVPEKIKFFMNFYLQRKGDHCLFFKLQIACKVVEGSDD